MRTRTQATACLTFIAIAPLVGCMSSQSNTVGKNSAPPAAMAKGPSSFPTAFGKGAAPANAMGTPANGSAANGMPAMSANSKPSSGNPMPITNGSMPQQMTMPAAATMPQPVLPTGMQSNAGSSLMPNGNSLQNLNSASQLASANAGNSMQLASTNRNADGSRTSMAMPRPVFTEETTPSAVAPPMPATANMDMPIPAVPAPLSVSGGPSPVIMPPPAPIKARPQMQ